MDALDLYKQERTLKGIQQIQSDRSRQIRSGTLSDVPAAATIVSSGIVEGGPVVISEEGGLIEAEGTEYLQPPKPESAVPRKLRVKTLHSVEDEVNNTRKFYVGGDRLTPLEIFELPLEVEDRPSSPDYRFEVKFTNTGYKRGDWLVALKDLEENVSYHIKGIGPSFEVQALTFGDKWDSLFPVNWGFWTTRYRGAYTWSLPFNYLSLSNGEATAIANYSGAILVSGTWEQTRSISGNINDGVTMDFRQALEAEATHHEYVYQNDELIEAGETTTTETASQEEDLFHIFDTDPLASSGSVLLTATWSSPRLRYLNTWNQNSCISPSGLLAESTYFFEDRSIVLDNPLSGSYSLAPAPFTYRFPFYGPVYADANFDTQVLINADRLQDTNRLFALPVICSRELGIWRKFRQDERIWDFQALNSEEEAQQGHRRTIRESTYFFEEQQIELADSVATNTQTGTREFIVDYRHSMVGEKVFGYVSQAADPLFFTQQESGIFDIISVEDGVLDKRSQTRARIFSIQVVDPEKVELHGVSYYP